MGRSLEAAARTRTSGVLAAPSRVRALTVVVVVALLAALVPPAPAHANVTVETGNTQRVIGDLTSQTLRVTINGRVVRGNILHFRDSESLRLRPRLAGGVATGTQTMPAMIAGEYGRGAIAGINGGYFVGRPSGNPNGLHVQDGRLVASHAVGSPSGYPMNRAAVGIHQDGRIVGDKIRTRVTLDSPELGLADVVVHDVNRDRIRSGTFVQTNRVLLYDRFYGRSFAVDSGDLVVTLTELPLGSSGRTQAQISSKRTFTAAGTFTPAAGTTTLKLTRPHLGSDPSQTQRETFEAHRALFRTVEAAPNGTSIGISITVNDGAPDWANLRGAVAGAGLVVKNGVAQGGATHADQGIDHASHRRARTAIGQLGNGRSLLLTIDETGGSSGVTLFELGLIMAHPKIGALDAVALDGGGSTTMAINGRTANRPSDPNRGHSSALFVYTPLPPPSRTVAAACPAGRVPSAGFRDIVGNTHATAIDCLAWWDVTQGLSPTSYGPAGTVTRQQMASFLARWLDDIAARGQAPAVPDDASNPFTDVATGSTHERSISRLASVGIITGTTATTYNPGGPVSRAQTAALVDRALTYVRGGALPDARDTFADDNDNRHEPTINRLAHAGVIGGTGGFNFSPDAPVTRAAMASLVMRATDLLVTEGRVTPPA